MYEIAQWFFLLINYLMREYQKLLKQLTNFIIFGNFKFKMEVQSPSEFQSNQNSRPISHLLQLSDQSFADQVLNIHIISLIKNDIPVFLFELKKISEQLQIEDEHPDNKKETYLNEKILTYNRKAKSLEQLSKKFIDHFEGRGNNIIQLDKITLELGVQRRRIYDIINILQSLNVVKKKGKNNYEWKGLHQAVRTITMSSNEGQHLKNQHIKSLQYLASGFLRLFINWKPAISLEEAAKEMMKDMDEASIKTKIRRLYDIINVFRSLGLVRRATLPSKKPGYQWAGTEYLECLIMKKHENDQNTRLNQLNQFQEVQISDERLNPQPASKRNYFSPLICPLLQKPQMDYLKQLIQTKAQKADLIESGYYSGLNQQFRTLNNEFPIFRRSTSAFSLVNIEQ